MRMIWPMRRRITKMKWNEDNTKVMMIWMRRMMMIRTRMKMKITQVGDASMCAADQGDLCTGQHHAITTIVLPFEDV